MAKLNTNPKHQMLVSLWGPETPSHTLLVGMENGTIPLKLFDSFLKNETYTDHMTLPSPS